MDKKKYGQGYIPKKVPLEVVMEIANKLEKGISALQLAREYNIDSNIIYRIKKSYTGIPLMDKDKYTEERRKEAIEKFKAGESIAVLAEGYGISENTIRNWAKKEGLYGGSHRRVFSKKFKDKAVGEYVDGRKVSDICREHSIAMGVVYNWIKKAGMETMGRGAPKYTEGTVRKALDMYAKKVSTEKIAEELGINSTLIYSWLKKEGFGSNRQSRISEKKRKKIRELWEKGYPARDISDITDTCATIVRRYIKSWK